MTERPASPAARLEMTLARRHSEIHAELADLVRERVGVLDARVNPITRRIVIMLDPAHVDARELAQFLEPFSERHAPVRWHGTFPRLRCAHCAGVVRTHVQALPGVEGITTNTSLEALTVEFAPRAVDVTAVRRAIDAVTCEECHDTSAQH